MEISVGTHLSDVINTFIPDSHETCTLLGLTTGFRHGVVIHIEPRPTDLLKKDLIHNISINITIVSFVVD